MYVGYNIKVRKFSQAWAIVELAMPESKQCHLPRLFHHRPRKRTMQHARAEEEKHIARLQLGDHQCRSLLTLPNLVWWWPLCFVTSRANDEATMGIIVPQHPLDIGRLRE